MLTTNLPPTDQGTVRRLFDRIAGRYDLLNSLLSFYFDQSWRKRSCDLILEGGEETILDLGVGTGKFLEIFLDRKVWRKAVGVDFAEAMLLRSRAKLSSFVDLIHADIHLLPFGNESFDLVISSFTLRSVRNMREFMLEIHRVLRDRGKIGLLCLTRPRDTFYRAIYYPYLKFYVPFLGGVISGTRDAYQFLSESIQHFPDPAETIRVMKESGFGGIEAESFTMGSATLIMGRK